MNQKTSRRDFLGRGVLGGAGIALSWAAPGAATPLLAASDGVCVTVCNHWSYIGIGWQLGIESNVLSVIDAMEMADRPPHVKTCINLDARAYEFMAEKFPEVAERLKKYLAEGKVELIGGTYGQPLGTMFTGESNIRQIVYGRQTIRKALGYEMVTFLEEEEFTHPQMPQILVGAGFRYGSLAQVDTWGKAGIPLLELNCLNWKGMDGTTIPTTPKNSLYSAWSANPNAFEASLASPVFKKLQALGKSLVFVWEEFGWEPHENPDYLHKPENYQKLADQLPVEFVTLKEYMDKYGANPRETMYLNMDAWNKLLTWGLGGDQLRILDRKVEGLLLAAERFDAIASTLGARTRERLLEKAWKNLLASQSHDVSLCEYSRWQGDRMAPLDRIEDYHNFTWGAIGYNHLDAAQNQGQEALNAALGHIVNRVGSQAAKQGQLTATVFNPNAWERTDIAMTGRIHPLPVRAKDVVVKDRSGRVVPSQIIKRVEDGQGNLVVVNVAFVAERVPSVGYETYYLDFTSAAPALAATRLQIDEPNLGLENEHLKVRLDPTTGAVRSLIDKRTGQEMLDQQLAGFPVFRGRANPDYRLRVREKEAPEYDSSKSKAEIRWLERGPIRATVKARHNWPFVIFETHTTLYAHLPYVEVTSRILAEVPPALDTLEANGRFPAEIKEGYWYCFSPNFQPASVLRDFPLGIEPTAREAFQALTFVDLVGRDMGLLLLHPGTQYFKREGSGIFSNLVMREWESHFTKEYGWPRYSEYRHALMPHSPSFTNAERLRAAVEFSQKLLTVVGEPHRGDLPSRKGFIDVSPPGVQLSALRKKAGKGYELRVVEMEGQEAEASVELGLPVVAALETNLLGKKVGDVARQGRRLSFKMQPWKIRTFELA